MHLVLYWKWAKHSTSPRAIFGSVKGHRSNWRVDTLRRMHIQWIVLINYLRCWIAIGSWVPAIEAQVRIRIREKTPSFCWQITDLTKNDEIDNFDWNLQLQNSKIERNWGKKWWIFYLKFCEKVNFEKSKIVDEWTKLVEKKELVLWYHIEIEYKMRIMELKFH